MRGMDLSAASLDMKVLIPSANAIDSLIAVANRWFSIMRLFLGHTQPRRWGGYLKSKSVVTIDIAE